MVWVTRGNSALVRALVVTLAIFGTGADALPIPLFASAATRDPDGEGPFRPAGEDERDETPDEASDLAWPLVRVVARSGSCSWFAARVPCSRRGWKTLDGQHVQRSRRDSSFGPTAVRLSITLCRLTC